MTKGRNIKNSVKSQLLFDVHLQYVRTFLIDLQAAVSRFRCRIFHCFAYILKIKVDYHRFLSVLSYPLVIDSHLESYKNKLFELEFSISKKRVSTANLLWKMNFFAWL